MALVLDGLTYVPTGNDSDALSIQKHLRENSKSHDFFRKILKSLHKNPFISKEERCKEVGIHTEEMDKWFTRLEEKGLIAVQEFGYGRGQPKVGALLTEEGMKLIGAKDPIHGKGSLQHRFLADLIMKSQPHCFTEVDGADVVQYVGEEKFAFEIELSRDEHFLSNIHRDIAFNADVVIVVTVNKEDAKALKKAARCKLPPEAVMKTRFMTIEEVLKSATLR